MTKQKQLPSPKTKRKTQEAHPDGKPAKKELQKYTPEEARYKVLQLFRARGDLNNNLQMLGDDVLPKLLHGNEKEQEEAKKKTLGEEMVEVMIALETDTHWGLMGSFNTRYWGLAKEFSNHLIKEYNCSTVVEKALAEVISNAYIRVIDNSAKFNNCIEADKYISDDRTKYLAMLSKQLDRANRQFLNSLMTLKQLKAPTIEMNIKTNTAFVSQNQQINVPRANNETNEPK